MVSTKDGMVLVYVLAGEFLMGSISDDPDAYTSEFPQHAVFLDTYWIDRTEVTNQMYADFLNDMGNQKEGRGSWGYAWLDTNASDVQITQSGSEWIVEIGKREHPVVNVNW